MPLLTTHLTATTPPQTLTALGSRMVWLRRALTGPASTALHPRERDLLSLIATSSLGVDVAAATRFARRFGILETAPAIAGIENLLRRGYVHAPDGVLDIPATDLHQLRVVTDALSTRTLTRLGWRAVWLHTALTGHLHEHLPPREMQLLELIAVEDAGLPAREALRRVCAATGASPESGQAAIERMTRLGYLSAGGITLDLNTDDLEVIDGRSQ